MTKKIKILIFPAESENAFEIHQSLRYSTRFETYGASSKEGYASHIFKENFYLLPNFKEEKFIQKINEIIDKENISFIISTHDDTCLYIAKEQEKINAKLIGSSRYCAEICREKIKTYKILSKEYFCPQTFKDPDEIDQWPVFIKPNIGQGSVNSHRIDNIDELLEKNRTINDPVICEYLPGEELTVDCFTNNMQELVFIGPRTRENIKIGISFSSKTIELTPEIIDIAYKINLKIRPHGIWFFQLKRNSSGAFRLLEVACRASSGMGLYRQVGINLPLLAAYDAIGMNTKIIKNNFPISMKRRLKSTYSLAYPYRNIYIDYDDTLITDKKVNTIAISLLYKCLNENKKVFLITRHAGDLKEHMEKHCIPESIFEKIIIIKDASKKSQYITEKKSIFIDNLFSEREEVSKNLGIPVFDVDAIDALI